MPHVFEHAASAAGSLVAGRGVPVVMLHTSLSSKSQWKALAQRLAPRFEAIAVDLVGYGDNPLPPPASLFTIDDEARPVERRLQALVASRPFHLVGHSYGALVALRIAQRYPDRVLSLSIYEPVAFHVLGEDDPALPDLRALAERVQRHVGAGRNQEAAQTFVDFWNGSGYYAALPPPTRHAIARRAAKVPLDLQAALRWRAHPSELRAVATPTLLLVGTESPSVTQRVAAGVVRAIADCRLDAFDAGHLGPIAVPDVVNPRIEAFIDECERTSPARALASAVA